MPDPFERHARGDGWAANLARRMAREKAAQESAHPEVLPEGKRPPSKEKPGVCKSPDGWKPEHTPVFRKKDYGWTKGNWNCRWEAQWRKEEPRWSCYHEEVCSACGLVLTVFPRDRCPDFRALTEEDEARVKAEREKWSERRAVSRRKKAPSGKQGYRKPKGK